MGGRMKNKKTSQRDQVLVEFGILVQPLYELLDSDPPATEHQWRIAIAKTKSGDAAWRKTVDQFTRFGPDLAFQSEYQQISHIPERACRALSEVLDSRVVKLSPPDLNKRFADVIGAMRASLDIEMRSVPVEWEPEVFEANTPFTAYLRILEAFRAARVRLHYFDRYLKPDFYRLFLPSVERNVEVRIVTTAGKGAYGTSAVLSISKLVGSEFSDYKLLEVDAKHVHDRNLRVDDQILSLGPGVDRAGFAITNFGPADSSPQAHTAFDDVLALGREII
jgi:hypothetical protein